MNAEALPEHIRDIPEKRGMLVAGLIAEHGGPATLTVKEALLIDRIGRLWPYLELMDRASFDAGKPDNRASDYIAIHNALTRTVTALEAIAKEKRQNPPPIDLRAYLEQRTDGGKPEGRNQEHKNNQVTDATVHAVSEESSE